MSDFAALQTALTGLMAHRRALEVIGHNIANANTEGFTRRRVELQPVGTSATSGLFMGYGPQGGGVVVADVTRMRDDFLDLRMRREIGSNGSTEQLVKVMDQIEQMMPEPSDTGLASQLSAFWGTWDEAAAHPGDLSIRSTVLQQADTVIRTLNNTAASLGDLRTQLVSDATTVVAQVNADSARVAELNASIHAAGSSGVDTADLADQRDLIIDRIVAQTGATTRSHADGTVDVYLGGSTLVRGDHAESLAVVTGGPLDPPYAAMGLNKTEVRWALDGYRVDALSGHIGADIQGINSIVPRFIQQMDGIATQLVTDVNALHQTGHGLAPGDVNLDFFDPTGVTAATISVSASVANQPSRLAVAAASGGALDGTLGHLMGALVGSAGGADAKHRTLIGQLGIDVQTAQRRADVQSKITKQAGADRQSASGVSLDEEMTSLVATQRAYEASARVMTAVDQMLDVLISRTGVVGR
jgi:flagellar hook-associated protein 1 FlgK